MSPAADLGPATPRLAAVCVGTAEELTFEGTTVSTAFRKQPVSGPIEIGELGLVGDEQADPTVHGGPDQAAYAYPQEHYSAWETEVGPPPQRPAFGENLIVEGLSEHELEIGDRLEVGSALFEITQPRSPCRKLSVVWEDRMMTKRFAQSQRPGFYLRVVRPGVLTAGDGIVWHRAHSGVTLLEVYEHRMGRVRDPERGRLIAALPALGGQARDHIRRIYGLATPAD